MKEDRRFGGNQFAWTCGIPSFSSLFRSAVCRLVVDTKQAGLELDITVADRCVIVINTCEGTCECTVILPNGSETVLTFESDRCKVIELGKG
jgi:ubiquinone biosynthesis protein UbiJ